jgi:hypothetical protein
MAIFNEDFLSRILGGQPSSGQPVNSPTPSASAIAMPTLQNAQAQDYQNAMMNRMGQLGMLLVAAGQRMTPKERATIIAQAPQYMGGIQGDVQNAAQARLMAVRAQQEQNEQARQASVDAKLSDPQYLAGLGIKPEVADAIGSEGIKKLIVNQALANTPDAQLDRRYKQAQIDHLLAPPAKAAATPQMVDLPGGGKGWATPGSTDVVPIGGAGKGGVDPENAKRTETEDKNLTYAKEAIAAHKILSDPKYSGDLKSGYKARVNMIPALNGSWAGDKYLTGDAQANSFVDSVVRPRSGAVVGPAEMADKKRIFTPMPGDEDAQLIQKAQMRAQHIQSLIAGSNPADRPMLQKLYDDSISELQRMADGYKNNDGRAAPAQSRKVKSIRQIN